MMVIDLRFPNNIKMYEYFNYTFIINLYRDFYIIFWFFFGTFDSI